MESLGLETNIYAKFVNPMESVLNAPNPIVIKVPKRVSIKTGDELTLGFTPSTFHFFDPETQLSIVKKPEETEENPEIKEKFQKELEQKEQG